MIKRSTTALMLACLLASGPAWAQSQEDREKDQGASPTVKVSVKLATVIADIPVGTPYMSLKFGGLCFKNPINRTWVDGRVAQRVSPYYAPFKTEVENAGFKVVTPGEENLFDPESSSADYEVAAVITDEHVNACVSMGSFADKGAVRGDGSMMIDWQIYSPIKKEVVAHVQTSGTASLNDSVLGGFQKLIMSSFAANVRLMATSTEFRNAMNAPRALAEGFQLPHQQSKIALAGSLKAGPRRIADAVASVVTIMNDIGSGSGVLISSDGYILTDAHVVGDDKEARVRWSDGLVTLGQVVRVAKNRDVAILKTNPRDRSPLAIRRGRVTPGQRVYAIGSPKGKDFEGTVSSGIISADRVVDGLRYIQSDTMVSHGSSGGPLLDETGAVIGLTDLGIPNEGPAGEEGQAGLNLFTPIGDAMDFLALEQK
jgi:S1-C subfamily serine protease